MKVLTSFDSSLATIHVHRSERAGITGQSKGNQLKGKSNGRFIRLDCFGYESIAEHLVSVILKYTNLSEREFVEYHVCDVVEDGRPLGRGFY